MNKSLIAALLVHIPTLAFGADTSAIDAFRVQHPFYYCNRLLTGAFQYCSSSPWACPLTDQFKAPYEAWAHAHVTDFKRYRKSPLSVPDMDRAIREQAMAAIAEELKHPNAPGPFTALAQACEIQPLSRPAP